MMLRAATAFLLLLSSATSFNVRSTFTSNRFLHNYQSHIVGTRLIESLLFSTIEVDRKSDTVRDADEFDLNLIDGMGDEMMQLIVEAATLKLRPKWGIDSASDEMML